MVPRKMIDRQLETLTWNPLHRQTEPQLPVPWASNPQPSSLENISVTFVIVNI